MSCTISTLTPNSAICHFCCTNRCNVCNDAVAGEHSLPVYLCCICTNAESYQCAVPVAVFILGVSAGLEMMSCRMLFIMSLISFGVLVASYGEINVNWIGVVYQMGGVVGEALRLIFMEIFVKKKGLKLNPISMMYYWSLPPNPVDISRDAETECKWGMDFSTSFTDTQFPLYFCIEFISLPRHLTYKCFDYSCCWSREGLGGCTFVSLLFADTKLTTINLFGYGIAIAGVAAYNNYKLKREVSHPSSDDTKASLDDTQEAESVPLTTSISHSRTDA